jgi:glycosyltransferase involved in cell wall biosynthesis
MIPEDFPEFFEGRYPHFQKGKFLEDADVIICVSEYTKSRLAIHYPHLIGKAKVIYNGVNLPVKSAKSAQRKSQFLYVGDRGSYKDFPIAASAFSMILKKYPQTSLLCIGGKPFNREELTLLHKLGINENISQISVSEQELQQKYSESIATVISSRVEGFGLPVIEAMANNCLVIATDIPVFNEIAAGAYLKFQSGDVEALFGRMLEVVEGLEDFEGLRISGLENAKMYSWSRMYQELEEIYLELE